MSAPGKPSAVLWSKHRVEALTDGIFAVAMTLLVIELKLPDPHVITSQDQLTDALVRLTPKAVSWVLSFLILAVFWISHHRLFHYVRHVDSGLLWRNIVQLAFVSLMPFSAGLIGEFARAPVAQVIYNVNMVMLGLLGLWKVWYVRRHPELTSHPMEPGTYDGTLLRIGGLVTCGVIAIVIAEVNGSPYATFVYLLMMPIGRYSRHLETKARAPGGTPAPAPAPNHPEHP